MHEAIGPKRDRHCTRGLIVIGATTFFMVKHGCWQESHCADRIQSGPMKSSLRGDENRFFGIYADPHGREEV